MKKILRLLKHELQAAIAPFTCFFILFHLLEITKAIMLKSYGKTQNHIGPRRQRLTRSASRYLLNPSNSRL